uniref:Crossover junction endonuclease MUS81 n=2 Tax=Babesia bovis TaxID=5865 RepID=A7AVN8_BABBO|eukprot:XP_001609432.1 hypothetical protein [Babesia bovis T2Bo]
MVTASSVGVTFNTQNLTNQGSTCDASYQSLDNFCYSASGDVADAGSVPSDIYPRSSRIETMKLYDDLSDPYELMDDHGQISDRYRKLMEDYSDVARCYSQGYEYIEAQTQASVGHDVPNRAELTSPGTQERLQNCTSTETRTPVRNLLDLGLTQQTPIEISSSSKSDNDVRITTMHTRDAHVSTPPKLVPQREPVFDLDAALNEYELLTVVDNREIHDAAGRYQRRLVELYTGNDKQLVFRQLPLGDVIWLLKRKTDAGNISTQECSTPKTPRARKPKRRNTQSLAGDYEYNDRSDGNASKSASRGRKKCDTADDLAGAYVLEWVVERKTTADLAASINDGRYYDQKIRMLRLTGFKHVCYIFEDMEIGSAVSRVSAMSGRVSKASITSARIHTQMVTGFNVLRTTGMPHTAASIAFMHMHIGKVLQGRIRQANLTSAEELHSMLGKRYMTLAEWEVRNRKQNQMTYKELFGKQIRAIPGCSANVTQAILDTWPTPHLLAKGISRSNLAQINATLTKKLPKSKRAPISSKMYALYKKLYTKPRNALSLSTGGRLEAAAGSLYEDLAYTNLSCQL